MIKKKKSISCCLTVQLIGDRKRNVNQRKETYNLKSLLESCKKVIRESDDSKAIELTSNGKREAAVVGSR